MSDSPSFEGLSPYQNGMHLRDGGGRMKNLLIAQSGGPTVAINATLVGILQGALTNSKVNTIYGAIHGIEGVMNEAFVILDEILQDTSALDYLTQTPAAALGSCRFKLGDWREDSEMYESIISILKAYKIGYFIYIGGNDSMDTVCKLSHYLDAIGEKDIVIIGAPKTIDNDLVGTDHCPGFGSAAKYVAVTCQELERDISVYDTPAVTIVEIMGRNAGWLTAASALSRLGGSIGPSLIYLCEKTFDRERFIQDVKSKVEERTTVLVAVSEGIKDQEGMYISEKAQSKAIDEFGHKYIAGVGQILAEVVKETLGYKVRAIELNLMQRSAAHIASQVDLEESKMLGMKALNCAVEGISGHMVAIKRIGNEPYQIDYTQIPVEQVANIEKKVPLEWINKEGNDVTEQMMAYLTPLIQGENYTKYENGIPKHLILYHNK